jgi:RING/Ubox like zinc-binding domain/RNA recognition motif. (a.k.a. RRM, RBD, or RNP domain)
VLGRRNSGPARPPTHCAAAAEAFRDASSEDAALPTRAAFSSARSRGARARPFNQPTVKSCPAQPALAASAMEEEVPTCPLCLEDLDATDRAMQPCKCSYVVCCWCLNHIRERLNGLCPACRTPYEEQNFTFKEVSTEAAVKEAKERATAKKERERREKLLELERERARAQEVSQQKQKTNLKHARFIQRNLVYVIGLSLTLAREEYLRRSDMFGRFGRIIRVLVNRAHPYNADAPGGPSIAAYIQFARDIDASAAVRAMNNIVFDGREIRTAIACTKYCDTFVKSGLHCGNADCMYVHEPSPPDDVLSREDVLARQLGPPPPSHLFMPFRQRNIAPAPAGSAAAAAAAAAGTAQTAAANAATAARQAAMAAASQSAMSNMSGSLFLQMPMNSGNAGPPGHQRLLTSAGGRGGVTPIVGLSLAVSPTSSSSSLPMLGSDRYGQLASGAATLPGPSIISHAPRVNPTPPHSPASATHRSRVALEILSATSQARGADSNAAGSFDLSQRPSTQQLSPTAGWGMALSPGGSYQQSSPTRSPSVDTNSSATDGDRQSQQCSRPTQERNGSVTGGISSSPHGAPPGFEAKSSTTPLIGPPGFGAPRSSPPVPVASGPPGFDLPAQRGSLDDGLPGSVPSVGADWSWSQKAPKVETESAPVEVVAPKSADAAFSGRGIVLPAMSIQSPFHQKPGTSSSEAILPHHALGELNSLRSASLSPAIGASLFGDRAESTATHAPGGNAVSHHVQSELRPSRRSTSRFVFARDESPPSSSRQGGSLDAAALDGAASLNDMGSSEQSGATNAVKPARSRFDFADRELSPPHSHHGGKHLSTMNGVSVPTFPVLVPPDGAASGANIRAAIAAEQLTTSFAQLSTQDKLASLFQSAQWATEGLPPMPSMNGGCENATKTPPKNDSSSRPPPPSHLVDYATTTAASTDIPAQPSSSPLIPPGFREATSYSQVVTLDSAPVSVTPDVAAKSIDSDGKRDMSAILTTMPALNVHGSEFAHHEAMASRNVVGSGTTNNETRIDGDKGDGIRLKRSATTDGPLDTQQSGLGPLSSEDLTASSELELERQVQAARAREARLAQQLSDLQQQILRRQTQQHHSLP